MSLEGQRPESKRSRPRPAEDAASRCAGATCCSQEPSQPGLTLRPPLARGVHQHARLPVKQGWPQHTPHRAAVRVDKSKEPPNDMSVNNGPHTPWWPCEIMSPGNVVAVLVCVRTPHNIWMMIEITYNTFLRTYSHH